MVVWAKQLHQISDSGAIMRHIGITTLLSLSILAPCVILGQIPIRNMAPVAHAGRGQTVAPGSVAVLDGGEAGGGEGGTAECFLGPGSEAGRSKGGVRRAGTGMAAQRGGDLRGAAEGDRWPRG